MTEIPLCYICYETESPTNIYADKPCNCKGSMRIHTNCLQRMVSYAKYCMTCHTPYRFPKRYRGGLPLIIGIDAKDHRYVYTLTEHSPKGEIHGIHQELTLENQLIECSVVHHGERDGLYQEWYEDGTPHFEVHYDHDGKFGNCQSWHPDGSLKYKIPMYKGKANGLGRLWEVSTQSDYPYLRTIQYYINHETIGLIQQFYENKQIASETKQVKGIKYGRYKRWESDGTFHDLSCYYNGKKNGLHITYDKDGNVGDCFYYHEDEKEGLQQVFYNNRRNLLEYVAEIKVHMPSPIILEDVTDTF